MGIINAIISIRNANRGEQKRKSTVYISGDQNGIKKKRLIIEKLPILGGFLFIYSIEKYAQKI